MDLIAAKLGANMAMKALEESGQIGKDTSKVYTYDGNIDTHLALPFQENSFIVKISDDTPKLEDFKLITMSAASGIPTIEPDHNLTKILEATSENDSLYGARGEIITFSGIPVVASVFEVLESPIPETGLYLLHSVDYTSDGDFYAKSVDFGGIKPIDPKYLPNPADLPDAWIADLKTALGIA